MQVTGNMSLKEMKAKIGRLLQIKCRKIVWANLNVKETGIKNECKNCLRAAVEMFINHHLLLYTFLFKRMPNFLLSFNFLEFFSFGPKIILKLFMRDTGCESA